MIYTNIFQCWKGSGLMLQAWNQQILADEETYREMSKYSLSATRDITGGLSEESIAGVSGTYKKLNIDWRS